MSAPYRFGFIIEQALGHITHGKNIQENLRADPSVAPSWILPEWQVDGLAARIPVYRSNWTVRAGLRVRRGLAQSARRDRLETLFFHTQITAVLSQDWMRHIPSVVSLDATPLQYDRLGEFYNHAQGGAWLERLKWRMNRDCFKAARKIITWSEWAKAGLVDEYEVPPEKITVISPGVNTAFFARPNQRREPGPVKILFVGGNLERKGGRLLLDTFRALRAEALNAGSPFPVELLLVTKDSLPPEPGVTIYNDIGPNSPELRSLYHQSNIFCLPTQGDCLPMVLSEASAAALPIISTCIAAIPEIVQENKNGLVISPGNGQELKAALHKLIEDEPLRIRMGVEGVRIAQNGHDAATNTTQLLNLLKEIADAKRSNKAGR